MALLITHSDSNRNEKNKDELEVVPRLSKSEMTQQIPYAIDIARYTGPRKPLPPVNAMTAQVPSLAALTETTIIVNQARERDLEFLKDVQAGCNGYNTKKASEDRGIIPVKEPSTYHYAPH